MMGGDLPQGVLRDMCLHNNRNDYGACTGCGRTRDEIGKQPITEYTRAIAAAMDSADKKPRLEPAGYGQPMISHVRFGDVIIAIAHIETISKLADGRTIVHTASGRDVFLEVPYEEVIKRVYDTRP